MPSPPTQTRGREPQDHAPPGYEFALQVPEPVPEAVALATARRIFTAAGTGGEGMVAVAGHYGTDPETGHMACAWSDEGWMLFRPVARERG